MDQVSKEMLLASSDKTELDQSLAVTSHDNHSNNRCSRKSNGNSIGRRLSRRLSLVTKVPSILSASKLKQEILNTLESADFFRHDTVDCPPPPPREIEITLITPDKRQKLVSCRTNQTIAEVTEPILQEFQLTFDSAKLFLAGSLAIVDTSANVSLLVGDVLLIEHRNIPLNPIGDANKEYRITEQMMYSEIEYVTALRSASELYDNPIQISSNSASSLNLNNSPPASSSSKIADSIDLHLSPVFLAFANLATSCSFLINRIKNALEKWDLQQFSLSEIFNEEFWDRYDEYLDTCRKSRQLLRAKRLSDENFITVCRIRQGAAKYSLDSLLELPIQRLSEYEQYFENLLAETRLENQREAEEINRIKGRCKQALKRGQRESDLERIQDLFPNDCLRLYDVDALTMKVKGLMRKRSGAAARLHRALSTKSLRSESPPPSPRSSSVTAEYRQFIMDAPVHFTAGVQSQDRHLFLFNDLLLIAKARSGGNFKLKEKVRISEIWLTKCCLDEVSELNKSEATSFVLGWPTTNVVVTFSTQAARDLWWSKLHELYHVANEKEPCTTNIQVVYYDNIKNVECCKTFCVGPEDTSRDCIRLTLEQLGSAHLDVEQFQLWAKTVREEAPYPLIGHERPFAIKLSCLRDSLSSEAGWDMNRLHNVHDPLANRCHFILKSVVKTPSSINESKKSFKKLSTRGMRISHVFRKSINNKEQQGGCLFGLPLSKLSDGETLPKPVMGMLYQIFAKGPFVQGIFRKSANARLVRELREKLDSGNEDVSWEHIPVLVTAALLKDFLRSLPDPLLTTLLYPQWREAIETQNIDNKLARMKGVIAQLPKANHLLLTYFLCVLYHIARRSCHTLMSAANLGVCVGPSLLWSNCPNVSDDLRIVPAIVECLITHCEFLWGSHVTSLLGDLRDSGTEESDSTKRDDSSIDSLECSPPPRKDKISLSRDSGLTMSDSQLYTPDEEESGSTSSSGYDPAFDQHSKISSSMSVPSNYVRVYGGWEQRLNPNFQRQDWFRQRSRRANNAAGSKPEVRRSASEESLLDCNKPPPPTPPRKNKPSLHDFQSTTAPTVVMLPYLHRHHPAVYKKTVVPPMRKVDHLLSSCSNLARSSEAEKHSDNSDRCFNGAVVADCSYSSSSSASYSAMDDSQSKDDFKSIGKSTFANLSDDAYGGFYRRTTRKPLPNSGSSCVVNNVSSRTSAAPSKSNQNSSSTNVGTSVENYYANIASLRIPPDEDKNVTSNAAVIGFGAGDYYYTAPSAPSVVRQADEIKTSECEDSSTLSDDDCTPHVSRSNSRGNEVSTLRQVTPARVDNCVIRGRLKRKEERTTSSAAYRSRSVPPPPPYRPPPPATSRRAPITSYYLSANGDCDQPQKYVITRTFMDEESYV